MSAEGDLDFRGTLGVAKDAPVGFREIRLTFDVDTDAPQDKLDQLLKLTERYCVVYQTIKAGPPVQVALKRAARSHEHREHRLKSWPSLVKPSRLEGMADLVLRDATLWSRSSG